MRMQGPENNSGISHGGVAYAPDEEDCIDVPDAVIVLAQSHGFTVVPELPTLADVGADVDTSKLEHELDDLEHTLDDEHA